MIEIINSEGNDEDRKFRAFVEATRDRITEIGIRKGGTVRQSQVVSERLWHRVAGECEKVTDRMIEEEFDVAQ